MPGNDRQRHAGEEAAERGLGRIEVSVCVNPHDPAPVAPHPAQHAQARVTRSSQDDGKLPGGHSRANEPLQLQADCLERRGQVSIDRRPRRNLHPRALHELLHAATQVVLGGLGDRVSAVTSHERHLDQTHIHVTNLPTRTPLGLSPRITHPQPDDAFHGGVAGCPKRGGLGRPARDTREGDGGQDGDGSGWRRAVDRLPVRLLGLPRVCWRCARPTTALVGLLPVDQTDPAEMVVCEDERVLAVAAGVLTGSAGPRGAGTYPTAACGATPCWGSFFLFTEDLPPLVAARGFAGLVQVTVAELARGQVDVVLRHGTTWTGAAVTAVLFTIGKSLIGLYLGRSTVASVYGAAGSLIVILLWIYYSAQIVFFGAEFTKVYSRRFGAAVVPDRTAVTLTAEARGVRGMDRRKTIERRTRGRRGPDG